MQEIEYMIYDTKYNDIKQILQDTLPEDNEWDVIEIKIWWDGIHHKRYSERKVQ